jgi:hypothetical protein
MRYSPTRMRYRSSSPVSFSTPGWPGILGERVNGGCDAALYRSVQRPQVAQGSGRELNLVRHGAALQPEIGLHPLPGDQLAALGQGFLG